MALRPHGITRLGYIHIALHGRDMNETRAFYCDVFGLLETKSSSLDRLMFKCWHESAPFSLVIENSMRPGLVEIGFEVADETELDLLSKKLSEHSAKPEPSSSNATLPGLGQSVSAQIPGGLKLRLYASLTETPSYVTGMVSPDWVTPRDLRATPAPLFLNHVGVTVPRPKETTDFLCSTLGFFESERIESDDHRNLLSALLFRSVKDVGGQELAIFQGEGGLLHHIAFTKEDFSDILIDAQYLRQERTRLDPLGPTRQSYGKTFSLYFFDPNGVRLELCSGGRYPEPHPEFKPVIWTEAHLKKALSFYDAEVPPGFLDPCL
jgi:catechol 2,3-dioxygenase